MHHDIYKKQRAGEGMAFPGARRGVHRGAGAAPIQPPGRGRGDRKHINVKGRCAMLKILDGFLDRIFGDKLWRLFVIRGDGVDI